MDTWISDCGHYRYRLSRNTDLFGRYVIAFFGINPSTADAFKDDPTVRKLSYFTALHNGKTMLVGNVFAYRTPKVKELAEFDDPVGPDNAQAISEIIRDADILVPCWGARQKIPSSLHPAMDELQERLKAVKKKPLKVFGLTKSGDPQHPLYLPYSTELIPWD